MSRIVTARGQCCLCALHTTRLASLPSLPVSAELMMHRSGSFHDPQTCARCADIMGRDVASYSFCHRCALRVPLLVNAFVGQMRERLSYRLYERVDRFRLITA